MYILKLNIYHNLHNLNYILIHNIQKYKHHHLIWLYYILYLYIFYNRFHLIYSLLIQNMIGRILHFLSIFNYMFYLHHNVINYHPLLFYLYNHFILSYYYLIYLIIHFDMSHPKLIKYLIHSQVYLLYHDYHII